MLPRVPLGLPMQFDRMKRRTFITLLGGAPTWPLAARAQVASRPPLVAYLVGGSRSAADRYFGGFSQGMRDLGYVIDRDYALDGRYADGDSARIPSLAEELVRLNPKVIVSGTMAGVSAAKKLT